MAELGCKGLRTHRMKEQVSGLQSARQSEQRSLFRPGHRDTKAIKGRQSRQGLMSGLCKNQILPVKGTLLRPPTLPRTLVTLTGILSKPESCHDHSRVQFYESSVSRRRVLHAATATKTSL